MFADFKETFKDSGIVDNVHLKSNLTDGQIT